MRYVYLVVRSVEHEDDIVMSIYSSLEQAQSARGWFQKNATSEDVKYFIDEFPLLENFIIS